jgi:hypothetical protein
MIVRMPSLQGSCRPKSLFLSLRAQRGNPHGRVRCDGERRVASRSDKIVARSLCPALTTAKGRTLSALQKCLGIEFPEKTYQVHHAPGPSGLMTGCDSGTVIAMKVCIEQHIVPPVRITLKPVGPS